MRVKVERIRVGWQVGVDYIPHAGLAVMLIRVSVIFCRP